MSDSNQYLNAIGMQGTITDNVDYLFSYALDFLNANDEPFKPAFHMFSESGNVKVVTCDSWEENRDAGELGLMLDKLVEILKPAVNMLVIVGKLNNVEIIGIIVSGISVPMFHFKPIIRNSKIIDFGPTVTMPCSKVKNLVF